MWFFEPVILQVIKKKARNNDWDILITTPESCALFTTYDDMSVTLSSVDVMVVDEWHVLLNQKRGILLTF